MKNAAYIMLSAIVITAAYMLTGTSAMVTTTNDVATFCRSAGFSAAPIVKASNKSNAADIGADFISGAAKPLR